MQIKIEKNFFSFLYCIQSEKLEIYVMGRNLYLKYVVLVHCKIEEKPICVYKYAISMNGNVY